MPRKRKPANRRDKRVVLWLIATVPLKHTDAVVKEFYDLVSKYVPNAVTAASVHEVDE